MSIYFQILRHEVGRQTNKERILRLAFGEFSLPIRLHIEERGDQMIET